MDSDDEITWTVTKNTVKSRMIQSSLIHRFTNSKKTQRRTKLLNNLLQRYRNFATYEDYVTMRNAVNKTMRVNRVIEEDDSYGEDDYLILHKNNLSLTNNTVCSNKDIDISHKNICNNNIKKPTDTISKEEDTVLTSSLSNEISSTDSDTSEEERERLKALRIDDESDDAVPVKKIRLLGLPKKCLEKIKETQLKDNDKNSSNSLNTTDNRVLPETIVGHVIPKSESIENEPIEQDKSTNSSLCYLKSPPQKSPPKITSTEIIIQRYKIIDIKNSPNGLQNECYNNIRLSQSSTSLNCLQFKEEDESESNEEYEDNMNSSTLSILERRQQQIKNLNLSVESTSSSSEDEIPQKTNNVAVISPLNNLHCITPKKNTTWSKLKLNKSYNTNCKEDRSSLNDLNTTNINCSNGIDKHSNYNEDLAIHKIISSKNVEPKIRTLCERPRDLENFIKEEDLIQDTTSPAFTLKDFSKDEDIFLVDIPVTVKLADLQGHKIILTEKHLQLGKNKYEIFCKDMSTQSCIFNTCADSKPYQLVNIKPAGSVVVKRKLL